uniref:Uncharacterized protein n=1 Tax=Physcomitrium patens TaxID=3218 RepID=A0A2K1IH70_PHYPA|nr:hypothetical protein PHYPA_029220 [Physcomitrium patens]
MLYGRKPRLPIVPLGPASTIVEPSDLSAWLDGLLQHREYLRTHAHTNISKAQRWQKEGHDKVTYTREFVIDDTASYRKEKRCEKRETGPGTNPVPFNESMTAVITGLNGNIPKDHVNIKPPVHTNLGRFPNQTGTVKKPLATTAVEKASTRLGSSGYQIAPQVPLGGEEMERENFESCHIAVVSSHMRKKPSQHKNVPCVVLQLPEFLAATQIDIPRQESGDPVKQATQVLSDIAGNNHAIRAEN